MIKDNKNPEIQEDPPVDKPEEVIETDEKPSKVQKEKEPPKYPEEPPVKDKKLPMEDELIPENNPVREDHTGIVNPIQEPRP